MELFMLDTILFVLNAPPVIRTEEFISNETKRLMENQSFRNDLFLLGLKKLVIDGYAEQTKKGYNITIDGRVFLKDGGYLTKSHIQKLDETRAVQYFFQNRKILFLTYAVAFGSLLSGLYYLIEICKWLF